MMEVKDEKHVLNGLWLWDCEYSLHEDAFSKEVERDIKNKTTMTTSSLGDWWVFPDENENPILTWPELIKLSLNILNCEATRLFVYSLYLKRIPEYKCKKITKGLKSLYVSGAKRVNASAGDYTDYSGGYKGTQHLMAQLAGKEIIPKKVKLNNTKFRLSGKDESCVVEGSWLHWCMFACNVLASVNTKQMCPELYAPGLQNENH